MAKRKHPSQPEKPISDYQMFPVGMWHMFGAVLLMVACLIIAVMLLSDMAALWVEEPTLMYLELAVMAVLALILSSSTFLLSRGRSFIHGFLIWHNQVYVLILLSGSIFAFLAGTPGMTIVGVTGLGFAGTLVVLLKKI